MSKIIKKNDITKLVESTMIQAGLLKEGDSKPDSTEVMVVTVNGTVLILMRSMI